MGKKSRLKKERRLAKEVDGIPMWVENNGIHSIVEGEKPTPEKIEEMEKAYRENIRNSPIWDMMMKEYGKARAEELLLEFKVKID